MKIVSIHVSGSQAGILEEHEKGKKYTFRYLEDYDGQPVSLALPVENREYEFTSFPPFLDGLLPEGVMLESLLRQNKIDKNDYLSQILSVGDDLIGAITVREVK